MTHFVSFQVGELKEEIDAALSGISKFIKTQMDGTVAWQKALQKVEMQEQREQKRVEISQVQGDVAIVQQTPASTASSNVIISVQ